MVPHPLDFLISHPPISTVSSVGLNNSMNSSLAPFCPRVRNSLIRMLSDGVAGVAKISVTVNVTVGLKVGMALGVLVDVTVSVAVLVGVSMAVGVKVGMSVGDGV